MKKRQRNQLRRYGKIKKAADLFLILKKGSQWERPGTGVYYLPNKTKCSRLGIIISKESGTAVIRNKIKRTVREYFRKKIAKAEPHFDLLIKINSKNAPLLKKQIEDTLEKWLESLKP